MTKPANPIIAAIDTTDLSTAMRWSQQLNGQVGMLKLGLAFYLAHGAAGVRQVTEKPVFLDLKLHDIPNTVAGGVTAVLSLGAAMLTLHAGGGTAMIAAARNAAETAGGARPKLLAVTVLTSLSAEALAETGVADNPSQQVLRLAKLALKSGADGLVCSPLEVAMLRAEIGPEPLLVVPGIRPAGAAVGDQARTLTPREAIGAGADWLVIGRPITGAADPAQAAAAIAADLEQG
ncbi:orotidine-5'-phosphate decarboxylase [Acidisoma cellulosilytica]|uniref:Orotidine 5'-phosphate decarboxylase n=1 Tax=Acidisoma cellulosilyticum TaxID=2802395 RepID=A0A964E1U7_9PROT|nr:orotidine-5'-phosphate decarboxylase [Acidisoma cellulosilyticum]MCB8878910.1 orotidine-5'-phosphate decarboxylase [Acidisoma cellulosilyticum]